MLLALVCNQLVLKRVFREPDRVDKQLYHRDAHKQLENKHSESCGFVKQASMQEVKSSEHSSTRWKLPCFRRYTSAMHTPSAQASSLPSTTARHLKARWLPSSSKQCPLSPVIVGGRRWPSSDGAISAHDRKFVDELNPAPASWEQAWGG